MAMIAGFNFSTTAFAPPFSILDYAIDVLPIHLLAAVTLHDRMLNAFQSHSRHMFAAFNASLATKERNVAANFSLSPFIFSFNLHLQHREMWLNLLSLLEGLFFFWEAFPCLSTVR